MKTHKLTLSAMISAAAVVFMIVGTFVKTGTLALYAALSLMIMIIRAENGAKYACMSYVTISILAAILPIDRKIMLAFVCVFGIYPIIKSYAEKQKNILQWAIKITGFNICFALMYFLMTKLVGNFKFNIAVAVLAANAAFIFYDIILSYAYTFYVKYVKRLIK